MRQRPSGGRPVAMIDRRRTVNPPSPPEPPGLFDGVFAAGEIRHRVSDGAWLRALLDAEGALARAQGAAGLIPAAAAARITEVCATARPSTAELGAAAAGGGNPVIPLVSWLRTAVGADAADHVHHGATSQDIMDTAAMLVAHRALGAVLADLRAVRTALAALAAEHRDTPMAARTLLQQALPTTFGLVAAGWLSGVAAAADRLAEVRARRLAAQLGGAAGTLASFGPAGPALVEAYAAELGLAAPALPWHTERTRIAELAGALGGAAGALAKPARDITLLAQTEVGELAEVGPPGSGGSSALPHKRNPIAAVSVLAAAAQAPGEAASLLAAMVHEHQRAAGAWHAEWPPLRRLLTATGSAAHWLRTSLERLHVDAPRMRANLDLTGGLLLAERVTADLAPELGRAAARELVTRAAAAGGDLAGALAAELARCGGPHRTPAAIASLLDPAGYLGAAAQLTDRTVRSQREEA
ncbi:3-carboxy-cis,cis-muconate cycloisomerase [Allonocardiopsis opalescens]|uniref:3-carboxy-cis,cis-muconate cycloisomerase n=1 Tax=Allonocardiopsis opalescens TaxID=1144618 RepID=A0A2T0Q7N8_9ACTN|nr:3-carboxy-cis,cis-muconate cycloisomerase [Allonocardiopsis opalescens]PRX99847.1 3-carboxy-cis,cis-muconate cycloisomerase [Allonocardiopsis opalescens]